MVSSLSMFLTSGETPHLVLGSPLDYFLRSLETDKVVLTFRPLHQLFPLECSSPRFFLNWLLISRSHLRHHSFRENSPEHTIQNTLRLSRVLFCQPLVYLFIILRPSDIVFRIFFCSPAHPVPFLLHFPECKLHESRNFGTFMSEPRSVPGT